MKKPHKLGPKAAKTKGKGPKRQKQVKYVYNGKRWVKWVDNVGYIMKRAPKGCWTPKEPLVSGKGLTAKEWAAKDRERIDTKRGRDFQRQVKKAA